MSMDISAEKLKNELQGGGFLSEIKDVRMPNSREMQDMALDEMYKRHDNPDSEEIRDQFGKFLEYLIDTEQDLYQQYEDKVYRKSMVYFVEDFYKSGQSAIDGYGKDTNTEFTEYPEIQNLLQEIELVYKSSDSFEEAFSEIFPMLYPLVSEISTSASQSRKKRAGDSLRGHVESLIKEAGFSIDSSRQVSNGLVYTISEADNLESEGGELYLASHMTLKDRFRQSLSELLEAEGTKQMGKYIATASGKNLITSSDDDDITKNKIREIKNEGFKLIVFEDVKDKFLAEPSVITYEDFIKNYVEPLATRV